MYKSQHGEDAIIERYCENYWVKLTPRIYDIGCGDGEHCSNSHRFIQMGWKAVLIDGNPELVQRVKNKYNSSEIDVQQAIITTDNEKYELEYQINDWQVGEAKKSEKGVESKRLHEIVTESCGILSLDIEGQTFEVYKDFMKNKKVRPQIIIIESNTEEEREEILRIARENEYVLLARVEVNNILIAKEVYKTYRRDWYDKRNNLHYAKGGK